MRGLIVEKLSNYADIADQGSEKALLCYFLGEQQEGCIGSQIEKDWGN